MREDYECDCSGGDEGGYRVGYLKSWHMEDKEGTKNDGLMAQ